jgi:hypothetical protein
MAKKVDQEKKPEDPKGDVPVALKEINYIFGGPDSYELRRTKVVRGGLGDLSCHPRLPEVVRGPHHLDNRDHPNFVPKLG